MDVTLLNIALFALVILLNCLLVRQFCFGLRELRRDRRAQQEQQRRQHLAPAAAPLLEAPVPEAGEEEEQPADEGGRDKQPRRRRRARRRRQQEEGEGGGGGGGGGDAAAPPAKAAGNAGKGNAPPPLERPQFPLALVAGALQRRINERYDDLVRAGEAQCLTIDQVNEFLKCLVDARNELLERYKNVQRSFKIKKAMLSNHKNYRSSYDRLFEQVRRLETERDNLKKDAAIYNSVQERLQASAPYKMIKELSAMELEAPEISFEELLAQEKEDTAFWQPNGKLRSISSK